MLDIWLFWRFDLLIGKNFDSIAAMSTVSEIIEAVKKLPEREKPEFLERLAEVDFEEAWDHQIEADAKAGRLDPLWQEAMEDIKAGRTKPLDEVLGNE